MGKAEEMMREHTKMMLEMKARMDTMEAKTSAFEKDNKELKKKDADNEKKLKALEKDNRKLKKESAANKGALSVLRNDNRKLKRNITAMRVGEEGIEVIGRGATPALHKTIAFTKTGESDGGDS